MIRSKNSGLSPRLRGTRQMHRDRLGIVRPIPAPAGDPCTCRARRSCWAAYPRACGGPRSREKAISAGTGLSPRLRGTRHMNPAFAVYDGPIPAPAGDPSIHDISASRSAAYPRACGGPFLPVIRPAPAKGLSPRLRGTPSWIPAGWLKARPIPAPAGDPARVPTRQAQSPAYPRACGGPITPICEKSPTCGLSPRLRGTPDMLV